MPSHRQRRDRSRGLTRAGSAVVAAIAIAVLTGCSGDGSSTDTGAVPTLLTVAVDASSSTSSSTTPVVMSADTTATTVAPGPSDATVAPGATTLPTASTSSPGGSGPVQPGASTVPPTSTAGTSSASSIGTTPAITTTTLDIEPAPAPITPPSPIVTTPEPPDTLGGTDSDYLMGATSLAGLQFGASQATVLTRMNKLLDDPLSSTTIAACAVGDAVAIQWFGVSVVLVDGKLVYYKVLLDLDQYEGLPVPGWRTAAGLAVGWDVQQLQAAYPDQVTVGAPEGGGYSPFDVTAGSDAGMSGVALNGLLQSIEAGTTEC
jgi:hypothetical protein